MREGYTTGTCAAAAALAAALLLERGEEPDRVTVELPRGGSATLPVAWSRTEKDRAVAAVRKDAGDDPDVTDRALVVVRLEPLEDGDGAGLRFVAGPGVGTVTKPGLQVPAGEAAINPVPRRMIARSIRSATPRALRVVVSVPGGEELARRTFNPRLGVVGGVSILGTTGVVRPFSHQAIRDTVGCALDVARAAGVGDPVLVPGHIGERAARGLFPVAAEQVVEVSNEWGYALDRLRGFRRVLALGHPGKLTKLAAGRFDTHSRRSPPAVGYVRELALEAGAPAGGEETVEGIFRSCSPEARRALGDRLAGRVRVAVEGRAGLPAAVVLVDMAGTPLGAAGDISPWGPRP